MKKRTCRPSRERTNLKVERTRLTNRIRSLFAVYGLVAINPNTPATRSKLDQLHTTEGNPLPPNLHGFTAKYVVSIGGGRAMHNQLTIRDEGEGRLGVYFEKTAGGDEPVAAADFARVVRAGRVPLDVAIALGLLPENARASYPETGESYYPALAELAQLAEALGSSASASILSSGRTPACYVWCRYIPCSCL